MVLQVDLWLLASFSLSIALFILQNYEIAIVSLPLGFVSLGFLQISQDSK